MKTLFKLFFVMFLASSAFGQGATCQSGYVCNGAETTNGDAVILYPPQDAATVVVNISGTWSGTISFKGSNGGVYVANTCTSQSAATTATTTTANDQWRCPVAGLTSFEAVSTASMTGSATVTVTASKGSPSLGGGGGSGTGFPVTTTVQVTSPGEINFATGSTLNLASGSTFSCAGTGCPAKTDLSNLASPTAMPAGEALCSSDTGGPCWTWGTNSITANQPVTVPSLSVSGNFNARSFSTTNSGVAGQFSYGQGTAPPENSSSVNVFAPTSVTTFGVQLPAVAPSVQSIAIFSAPSAGALTFNATPTAGGSSYVQGDVGSLLTLTCGAAVAITQVNSGSGTGGVTAIATAATTPGSGCATGTGQSTTGGTGTGATVNLTALAQITTQSYVAVTPTPTSRGLGFSAATYISPGGGGTTATGTTTQNHIRIFSFSVNFEVQTSKLGIYVQAADNSANSYDIGIYGPGCYGGATNIPLAAHTGTIAGSAFASATGVNNLLTWTGASDISAGIYCFAFTSSAASPTLNLGGGTNSFAAQWFATSASMTGGGSTLPSTITAPTLAFSAQSTATIVPSFIVY